MLLTLTILVVTWNTIGVGARIVHTSEFVDTINEREQSYEAVYYGDIDFDAITMDPDFTPPSKPIDMPTRVHKNVDVNDLPKNFDSRQKWTNCKSIFTVRDQSNCGNCWAVNAASTISDRMCIHSNGSFNVQLSATDVSTCCPYCTVEPHFNGCRGGDHFEAWRYWIQNGLVTGGEYGTTDGCSPYFVAPCTTKDGVFSCIHTYPPNFDGTTTPWTYPDAPVCNPTCQASYAKNWMEDKHFGRSAYNFIENDTISIMYEIMNYGPVETSFQFCHEFLAYKSGIYNQNSCELGGWHAIKIIGWGEENGTPFWTVANSFGESWGEKGFFRKLRDDNRDSFLSGVTGGLPKQPVMG